MVDLDSKDKIRAFFGILIVALIWMLIESCLLTAIGTNLTVSNTASQLFGGVGIAVTILFLGSIAYAFNNVPLLKAAVTVGSTSSKPAATTPQAGAAITEFSGYYSYANAPLANASAPSAPSSSLLSEFADTLIGRGGSD